MTTPDPSREAFEQWRVQDRRNRIPEFKKWPDDVLMATLNCEPEREWKIWQAVMAHKGAELEQAHEARRQAQAELADMQEKRNRIGLDIDRALRGEVNEQSPIAGRLKLIAEGERWQPIETAPRDGERILLSGPTGRISVGSWEKFDGSWFWPQGLAEPTHWQTLPAAPKQEGST